MRRSEELPVDDGLAVRLPHRGADLRQAYSEQYSDAKIAVLRQDDDFGMDCGNGFREDFGRDVDKLLVQTATYTVTNPTVES